MATRRELLLRKRELLLERKRMEETAVVEAEPEKPMPSGYERISDVLKPPFVGTQNAVNFGLDTLDRATNVPRALKQTAKMLGLQNKYTDALARPGEVIRETVGDAAIKYSQPEEDLSGGERAWRTGGEWFGPMATSPGNVARNVVTGVKSAFGAAGGEAIGDLMGAGTAGEIVGGLATAIVNPIAAAQKGVQLGKRLFAKKDANTDAVNIIREFATDEAAALKALDESIARGEKGTLAQRTQDPGLVSLQGGLEGLGGKAGNKMKDALREAEDAINTQATEIIGEVAKGGLPKTATAQAKATADRRAGRITNQTARSLSRADDIEQAAAAETRAAEAKVSTPDSATTASETMYGAVDELAETSQKGVNAAWDAVPKTLGVNGAKIRDRVANYINHGLNKTDRASLRDNHSKVLEYIDDLGDTITPQEAASIRTKVREARAGAFDKKTSKSDGIALGKIEDKVIEIIEKSHAGKEWRNAVNVSRRHYDEFGDEGLGKVLAKEPAVMADEVVKPGPRGAEGRRKLEAIDTPGPSKLAGARENDIRVKFKQAMATSAKKAEDFITRDYRDTLEKFPRLREELTEAVATRMESDALTKGLVKTRKGITDTAAKRQKQVESSPLREFGQFADDPVKAVEKILTSPTAARDTVQLVKNAEKAGPEAVTALKSAYRDALTARITAPNASIKEFSPAKLKDSAFSKVFSKEEMTQLNDGLRRAQKMYKDKRITAADMSEDVGMMFNVAVSLIGAKSGAFLFGSPLIGANLGRSQVREAFIKTPRKELLNMVTDININPEKYRAVLNEAKQATTLKEYGKVFDNWHKLYVGASQAGDN